MKRTFTAVIRKTDRWWIGWIEEVHGVNAQAKTRRQLLVNLEECLAEVLEFRREQAIAEIGEPYESVSLTV
jgi:predicted RNase H-like HicB family nuclease